MSRSLEWTVLLSVMVFRVLAQEALGQAAAGEVSDDVEFSVNGESVTRRFISDGLREANECAAEVCPTDPAAAWGIRRTRLIRLIPLRQFLDREGVAVTPDEIERRITAMKAEPNPFGRHPPKPLTHVMVRECMSWSDVRLLIRTDLGMQKWAEREWQRKWPSREAWAEYCRVEKTSFADRYGKFRRLSFSMSRWPKGAKDEEEALAMLKQEAERAKARLDAGETFAQAGASVLPAAGAADPAPAAVLPFDFLGPQQMDALRRLPAGETSAPLPARFSWEILRKETVSDEDMGEVLKREFVARKRLEAEDTVAKEAKLVQVHWTGGDETQTLNRE